jgi:hypothetical protein
MLTPCLGTCASPENALSLACESVLTSSIVRSSFIACVTIGVFAALPRPAGAQTDGDRAAARAAATAGLQAFNEGRFQDAVDLCSRAEALMHAPTHLLLVARAQAKLGHFVEAQEAYIRIKRDRLAADAPRAFVDAQASAAEEQAALAPRIPSIRISLEGPATKDVAIAIDGQNVSSAVVGLPMPVNPGQHVLVAHAASAESDPATVTAPEGATQSVTLRMHPIASAQSDVGAPAGRAAGGAAAPEGDHPGGGGNALRLGGWIAVGVGAVGAIVGTVFLVKNHSDLNDANAMCGSSLCPMTKKASIDSLDSSASQASTLAWVSYGVGVAGVGAGVAMLVLSGGKGTQAPQAAGFRAARPWVGPASAGITVAF